MIDLSNFWVVTPYFNSVRHSTRRINYNRFIQMCAAAGVNVLTVEVAFGDRNFEVTERDNPYHVQLRSQGEEFWLKEAMINVGIRYLVQQHPELIQNDGIVGWIDSDCSPMCPPREWFEKTKLALDHYQIVQMFEHLVELGPDYQIINGPHRGFMASYEAFGRKILKRVSRSKVKSHEAGYGTASMGGPGLAWAARLSTLTNLGMLLDITILGAGDWWMAHALLGLIDREAPEVKKLPEYGKVILQWQDRAMRYVKKDVGFVKMTVYHWFHGVKEGSRFYGTRGQILIRHKFNPHTDLKLDSQGLYQLETETDPERQIALRDDLRTYVHARNEDSVPLRQLPNLPEYRK
jgi:hypothetical protein